MGRNARKQCAIWPRVWNYSCLTVVNITTVETVTWLGCCRFFPEKGTAITSSTTTSSSRFSMLLLGSRNSISCTHSSVLIRGRGTSSLAGGFWMIFAEEGLGRRRKYFHVSALVDTHFSTWLPVTICSLNAFYPSTCWTRRYTYSCTSFWRLLCFSLSLVFRFGYLEFQKIVRDTLLNVFWKWQMFTIERTSN